MSKLKRYLISIICLFISNITFSQYTGTGSITKGNASVSTSNLYICTSGRITNLGTISSTDNKTWEVPAKVNFSNSSFPFASDLNNVCNGNNYSNTTAALAALNGSDIITIDTDGEIITAFVFADNYFEIYINGVAVGKDKVPFTQFNSSIVRFKVKRPFIIAMQLVDWEENLGLGSENNNGFAYHSGDGGMVAVFKDSKNNIIAKTDNSWKAQTYYISPIQDLTCPQEIGNQRLTNNCSTQDVNDGSKFYGIHWVKPSGWMNANFNDFDWPSAASFSNTSVGINNKPSYTNFADIFDDVINDAQFIWSSNLILDNEVLVRYTVPESITAITTQLLFNHLKIYPNPSSDESIFIEFGDLYSNAQVNIFNLEGQKLLTFKCIDLKNKINISTLNDGVYFVKIMIDGKEKIEKLIINEK